MGHADQTHPSSAPPLSSFGLELASHPRWTARSFLRVQLTGEEDESSIERSTRGLSHESSTFVEHFEGFLSCKFFQQLGGNWGNWCPRAPRAFDICFCAAPPRHQAVAGPGSRLQALECCNGEFVLCHTKCFAFATFKSGLFLEMHVFFLLPALPEDHLTQRFSMAPHQEKCREYTYAARNFALPTCLGVFDCPRISKKSWWGLALFERKTYGQSARCRVATIER